MSDRSLAVADDDMEDVEFLPDSGLEKSINEEVLPARMRGRGRHRSTGYRHQDNHAPKRVNRKPNREAESMMHDTTPPLKVLPDGKGRMVGYNMPHQVIDRFKREGFRLHFFIYGTGVNEYTGYGWRPVMISEIPEISLAVVPIPGLHNENLREYFIYRDHILMKIHDDDWAEYEKEWQMKMRHNDRVMDDASKKFESVDKRRGGGTRGTRGMVFGEDDHMIH